MGSNGGFNLGLGFTDQAPVKSILTPSDIIKTTTEIKSSVDVLLSEFIEERDDGIFVNLDALFRPEDFSKWLDTLFQSNYYFEKPKYGTINWILYNFEKISVMREQLKKTNMKPELLIADGKEEIKKERLTGLYDEPKINHDDAFAEYFFRKVYITETENGEKKEIETTLHPDEFFAQMWVKGIRYGIDMTKITAIINDNTHGRITIAKRKDPEEGTDACMEQIKDTTKKTGIKESSGGRANLREYEQVCVQVIKDELLLRKISRKDGIPGWSVRGERKDPEKPKDLDIKTFLGKGTYIKTEGGVEYIAAIYEGYPREEKGIISINDTYTFETGINVTSGNNHVVEDAIIENNVGIGYTIKGDKSLIFKGNVEGTVYAEEDINIQGDVIGKRKGGLVDVRNIRGSEITDGRVTSNSGNINAKGRVDNGYLEAKKGTITVENANNSFIIGDTVIITGNMFNCTIVANTVIIQGEAQSCRVLAKKNIKATKITTGRAEIENTYTLLVRDKKKYIENDKAQIEKMKAQIEKKQAEISAITETLPGENTDRKNQLLKYLKKCKDNKIFLSEQSLKGRELFSSNSLKLDKINKIEEEIKELENKNTLLNESIKQREESLEREINDMFIKIDNIHGYTRVQSLTWYDARELFETDIDDLEMLARITSGDGIKNIFNGDSGSVNRSYLEFSNTLKDATK